LSQGVGKTAIVEGILGFYLYLINHNYFSIGLAQRIVHRDVPDTLPHRLISLDMGSLVGKAYHFYDEICLL
jgi:ATP-dependent Clp protease ATP-binding subunit ClpA